MLRPPRPRATAVIVAAACVALLAGWLAPPLRWSPFYPCDAGLRAVGTSCVGVSDSSAFGDPLLAGVMSRIDAENESVTGPSYTVGYLLPLEAESRRTAASTELRRELAGAHQAQLRANRTEEIEGGGPKIKLVVGATVAGSGGWAEVVDGFREMAIGPERLRAVVGLGTSLGATQQAIAALTRPDAGVEPVGVIGSRLTADNLSSDPSTRLVDGIFRPAQTNTDQARAAVEYLHLRGYTRPVLLRDTNALDAYAATLGSAFRVAHGATAEETFDGGKDALTGAFSGVVRNLCVGRPDVVYFAGGGESLARFVDVLANRPCQDATMDIVTGHDISEVRERARTGDVGIRTALSGGVTLTYTGLVHPAMWETETVRSYYNAGALAYFRAACEACFPTMFPDDPIDDGAAIMGHDATLLAVTAIRRAGQIGDAEADDVSPGAAIQMLHQIRGANQVVGASGALSMSACGDPEGKVFPLLSLAADGTAALVEPKAAGEPLAC